MAVTALVSITGSSALAQPAPAPAWESPYVTEEPPAYTAALVVADLAALGLVFAGAHSEGPGGEDSDATAPLILGGIAAHLAGGPIVHAAHRQGRRAALSIVLRSVLPSTLGLISLYANEGCDGILCELDDFGTYFIGGMVLASVIDWAALSHGSTLATPRLRAPSVPVWSPTVTPAPGGAQVGVVGTF